MNKAVPDNFTQLKVKHQAAKTQGTKVRPQGTTQIRTEPAKKTRQTGHRTEGLAYIHRRVGRQRDTGGTHLGNCPRQETSKGKK